MAISYLAEALIELLFRSVYHFRSISQLVSNLFSLRKKTVDLCADDLLTTISSSINVALVPRDDVRPSR